MRLESNKGTCNGRPFPVSMLVILRKTPLFHLETDSPSPHETTPKARAPRPNRRGELRCTTASSRVDAALGSRVGALADCGLRAGWYSAPPHAGRVAPCCVKPSATTLVATGCDTRNGKAAGPIRRGSCSTAVVIGRRRPPRATAAYCPAVWVRRDVEAQVVLAGHPPPLALAAWNPWSTRC